MIDILKAKVIFKKYISKYNPEVPRIALKIAHIYRTAEISKNLAIKLDLEEEDIKLAELIGLLHDIGRFEQIRIYNTFNDKDSINHGEYGVKVLFEDGLIREFLETTVYDEIIRKSILNHNKDFNDIDKNITNREMLHTKIIRDADKTDILYILSNADIKTIYGKEDISNDEFSSDIFDHFINTGKVIYANKKTEIDTIVAHFAYIFDINYMETKNIINENKYIDKMYMQLYNTFKNEKTLKRLEKIYIKTKQVLQNT